MKKSGIILAAILAMTLLAGAAWDRGDRHLFQAKTGVIQGHTQRGDLMYIGYDKGELGGQIEVYKKDGTWLETIGPLPLGHTTEMDFADWNGYLYVADGTTAYNARVYEVDISGGEPRILRTIHNEGWLWGGMVAVDNENRGLLVHYAAGFPGELTFAFCDMDGNINREFKLKWIHVPQGIDLVGDDIYYYLNTKIEIICARNGCRKMTYPIPYEGENQGLSVAENGDVYIGMQSPPRIYNIGALDTGTCPCDNARPGWNKWQNEWYYYDANLTKQKGWAKVGSRWYMLDEYSGAMKTGWQQDYATQGGRAAHWYYMQENGAMKTGWLRAGSATGGTSWYYLKPGGAMATGWLKVGTRWYHFSASGRMDTGWRRIDGKWYWFGSGGAMAIGTRAINGKSYRFDRSGAMAE